MPQSTRRAWPFRPSRLDRGEATATSPAEAAVASARRIRSKVLALKAEFDRERMEAAEKSALKSA